MDILALAARGTLDLVADECRGLGLTVVRVTGEGVHLELDGRGMAIALVHLRIATRLLLKVAQVEAGDGDQLYEGITAVDWREWLSTTSTFAVYANGDLTPSTPLRRGLDNHIFVSLRIKDAIADQLVHRFGKRPNVDRDDPHVRILARGRKGSWGIYLDLCEPPLFQRGHRVDAGPAPLKETLAAAIAELSAWDGRTRLHDPMCGSGTLVIEAVGRVLGLAPGCTRWFAVERWPHHGERMQRHLDEVRAAGVDHARKTLGNARLDVIATDSDPHAVQATRRNLAAAGLDHLVRVEQVDATRMSPPPAGTVLVSNPPYGERLGGSDVTQLYAALGRHWSSFRGCTAHLVDGNPAFREAFGLPAEATHRLWNGPLEIALRRYRLGIASGQRPS